MRSLRFRGAFALAVLVSAALFTGAASAAASLDHAAFRYALGSRAQGDIQGTCEGRGLLLESPPTSALRFGPATLANLRLVDAWVNYTLLLSEVDDPIRYGAKSERRERSVSLDGAAITVLPTPEGRAALLETPRGPFEAEFSSGSFQAGGANSRMDVTVVAADHAQAGDGVAVQGWARRVAFDDGHVRAAGDFSVYLQEARVGDGQRWEDLPPYRKTTSSGGPGVQFVSEHFSYAWLDLTAASFATEAAGSVLLCSGLSARVDGSFTAYSAAGLLRADAQDIAFERRELTLLGAFQITESVAPDQGDRDAAPMQADAEGDFQAVGLDFAIPTGADTQGWAVAATAAAGGLVLAVLGFVVLYSRIAEDEVLERPERRRLYETIVANPGIEFVRLLEENPMSATNARYHLKLLERRGLVRVMNVQGRHRYAAANLDVTRTRQALLLSEDPKLRGLLDLLNGGGRPASELVELLRREWGLSRTGGWKVLDRAVRAHLVERLVRDRRVILRRAA